MSKVHPLRNWHDLGNFAYDKQPSRCNDIKVSRGIQLIHLSTGLLAVIARTLSILFLATQVTVAAALEEETSTDRLAYVLKPWVEQFGSPKPNSGVTAELEVTIDQKKHPLRLALIYVDNESFAFEAVHPDYEMVLLRSLQGAALILPKHNKIIQSQGELSDSGIWKEDHLKPDSLIFRSLQGASMISLAATALKECNSLDLANLLTLSSNLRLVSEKSADEDVHVNSDDRKKEYRFIAKNREEILFKENGIHFDSKNVRGTITLHQNASTLLKSHLGSLEGLRNGTLNEVFPDLTIEFVPRSEFERTIARGLRRATEILAPSPALINPSQRPKQVEHGKLEWQKGHRVVTLWGTPENIGEAHGKLLKMESMRCLDSVLHTFGTVQTIATGKWFRAELESAYKRLAPHIPERHKLETSSLARSLDVEPELLQVVNVFPELFHCSGFAVFGEATKGGKLYHGRVLDYMTTIGLQDAATTFIVSPDSHHGFANVGYAGFIGSVSGMNDQQISLGEMGGKGEGLWDGVPMATLMRRALEECKTLEDVKNLWRNSPRTCEYYYVFCDGKDRSAVGVAATPEKLEFVNPGQAHALLGEGIKDAVVMSAGNRLVELRKRVQDNFGQLDAVSSQNLMCRPVAMKSNLHNVLFVPEDNILFVANATHSHPAADQPYIEIDLAKHLNAIPNYKTKALNSAAKSLSESDKAKSSIDLSNTKEPNVWKTSDSITFDTLETDGAETIQLINGLRWQPSEFQVESKTIGSQSFLTFRSPIETGNTINDTVYLEWFRPKVSTKVNSPNQSLPAVLVVHESGRKMTVGKTIARGLAAHGVHSFMIHLPHYGHRLSDASANADAALALKQSVADVRRALDAIQSSPGIDASRVSLQGTSLGGFVATTAAGIGPLPHKLFIVLAGGDLPSVLKQGQKDAQKFRNKLLSAGLTDKTIDEALRSVEPLYVAKRLHPSKTWLFSGQYDDVVPPKNTVLLKEAIGLLDEHHISLPADHYTGILFLPTILKQIAEEAKSDT